MAQQQGSTTAVPPIIIDVGTVGKKKVRQLKEGRGDLALEVQQVLTETRQSLDLGGKEVVPIVLIYKRKRGRRGKSGSLFPF